MENLDPAQEWQQLQETYGLMTEDELCTVAQDAYDLTPTAREALQSIIRERGLKIELKAESPAPPKPDHSQDSGLETFKWVETMDEAKQIKSVLDPVFIPTFLGPDNVLDLEDFKGSFDRGVEVKVRAVDYRRAQVEYAQAEEEEQGQDTPDPDEDKEYAVLCPKCHSEEIVFEESEPGKTDSPVDSIFKWRCDACGYEWTDDGVEKQL